EVRVRLERAGLQFPVPAGQGTVPSLQHALQDPEAEGRSTRLQGRGDRRRRERRRDTRRLEVQDPSLSNRAPAHDRPKRRGEPLKTRIAIAIIATEKTATTPRLANAWAVASPEPQMSCSPDPWSPSSP